MTGQAHLCIHGHFYQPPRENPWLETIELQDAAYPYHDWNERIASECYLPNAASRILDADGNIVRVVNNYGWISFNVGPTLLAWLETHSTRAYAAVLEGDRASRQRYGGFGNALAQPYNHMIMPLASRADKETQVRWGLSDFRHRFGREPDGMWLPETAVDTETLEVLAEHGLRFTVLAPNQARAVRSLEGGEWRDVSGGRVDTRQPYLCRLPSGKSISLFFYDGPISRGIAFEGLLTDGGRFAARLAETPGHNGPGPALIHIATDGETYGHHHRHGEMALSYALDDFERGGGLQLTNYAWYLERFPPRMVVQIHEASSWSCQHGVERWRSDCGCQTGGQDGWSQAWRAPLRSALDWLRDQLAPLYERHAAEILRSPRQARDDYIQVILDRSPEAIQGFLEVHAKRPLDPTETVRALRLLELQRQAMLMYTSCGWFFNDLSGIETVQVLQYAGRAIQLARQTFGEDLEEPFLERLAQARSNVAEHGNGRRIWQHHVKGAMVDLRQVAAHYALASLFEEYGDRAVVNCYEIERFDTRRLRAGGHRATIGRARVTSRITRESGEFTFCSVHFGGHNVHGGARVFQTQDAFQHLADDLDQAFQQADIPRMVRLIDQHFPDATYSLQSLFRDAQRKILDSVLEASLAEIEAAFAQMYEHHAPLMHFLRDLDAPLPRAFRTTAEFVLNQRLRRVLAKAPADAAAAQALIEEARRQNVPLDAAGLAFAFERTLSTLMGVFEEDPADDGSHAALQAGIELAAALPFEVNLWDVQRRYYDLMRRTYPEAQSQAEKGDREAGEWARRFAELGRQLHVRVP